MIVDAQVSARGGPTKYQQAVDALNDPSFSLEDGLALAMETAVPDLVLAYIHRGAPVNGVPKMLRRRETPLMWAVSAGATHLCVELLSKGADPNGRGVPDSTFPLLLAAKLGRRDIVGLLLEHGAAIEATMGDYHCAKRNALMAASEAGQVEIVRDLCAAGANANAQTFRDGTTTLMLAAFRGSLSLCTILLDAGARVNDGCTDAMGDKGRGPLAVAAGEGWVEECQLFLERGAHLHAKRERDAFAPLHEAVEGGHAPCVLLLCQAGADVNALDIIGRSPLAIASEKKWTCSGWAICRILKQFGGRYLAPSTSDVGFHQMLLSVAQSGGGGGDPNLQRR